MRPLFEKSVHRDWETFDRETFSNNGRIDHLWVINLLISQ